MKTTSISIHSTGGHSHAVIDKTGATGGGQQFSLLQPFQTFNYIIYAGDSFFQLQLNFDTESI